MLSRSVRFAWYPLLLAAWPVVYLYARNAGEIPGADFAAALGVVLAATAAVYALLARMAGGTARAALVTSPLVLSILLYGHVANVVGERGWLVALWLAATALLTVAAWRAPAEVLAATPWSNAIAAVLLLLAAVPIGQQKLVAGARPAAAVAGGELDAVSGEWSGSGPPRDVYYLIFDRYGSQASLREAYGVDNAAFLAQLRQRGFIVTGGSKANHLKTPSSLASSLNLRYLTDLEDRYGPGTSDTGPLRALLADPALGRWLQGRGYTYVHIGGWFDPTAHSPQADVNLGYDRRSDFVLELVDSTLLRVLPAPLRQPTKEQIQRQGALSQFQALRSVARDPAATFTFAHVLLPHGPFVFRADGRPVSREQRRRWPVGRAFREQLAFTNDQILRLVDELLAVPEPQRPIIVLQADEGPNPRRYKRLRARGREDDYDWRTATPRELLVKFGILNAYYLPGVGDVPLYDDISPVNSWRVVLNAYFGTDLPLLDDRSYVFPNRFGLYDYSDVTHRLP